MRYVNFLVMLLISSIGCSATADISKPNVILLMLDGVRWQEFFHGSDPLLDLGVNEPKIFKYIKSTIGNGSFISGDRKNGSEATISNTRLISLPAYQSIMAGKTTACKFNSCGRISVETLQENILTKLNLQKTEVATIASWDEILNAVEHQEGRTFVNAGVREVREGVVDSTTVLLNKKQKEDSPSWDGRKDEYTFAHAINYLKNNKPRFLFISLNDSDEWAHKGNYPQYISTLKGYDDKIKNLFDTLNEMDDYGRSTTVIITTDHGRGNGNSWGGHGTGTPESKYIWIYGRNPGKNLMNGSNKTSKSNRVEQKNGVGAGGYTHLDIRPTIEKLLGLAPLQCEGCGKVIQELIVAP
ncbi:MAG: alkaline phosphatase family protein [Bdellovibrionia bacterium]